MGPGSSAGPRRAQEERAVGVPEGGADGVAQRVGLGVAQGGVGGVAARAVEVRGQPQRREVRHVGRERPRRADVDRVLGRPRRVRLLAPVQEGLLAAVEAVAGVKDRAAVDVEGGLEGFEGAGGEGRAERVGEVQERGARPKRPGDAVGADRPGAPRARVLHDLQRAAALGR
jgi:hypothetical protein